MLLLNDGLRLEGKGFGVAGTYLAAVCELRELGTRNCCLSPSASVPCCHHQEVPAVPQGAFGLSMVSSWAGASPGTCSEQLLAQEPRAVLEPCLCQRCPGTPVSIPGTRLAQAGHCRHSPSPAGPKEKRCWLPFRDSWPPPAPHCQPAGTHRNTREHCWQGAGDTEASVQLWDTKGTPAPAVAIILAWQCSPAENILWT